ncbi:MAG: hypothetical protein HQK62_00065 [Desulfamplus sp.]|nr:hypothetical protein [Desulfamplus sp.]MBF0257225.1 hypothetical protein [Desulfamplus sp.]
MKINKKKMNFLLFVFILILIAGCGGDEGEKGDYSTVSNMIADRNKARYDKAAQQNPSRKNLSENDSSVSEEISNKQADEKQFTGMTFEEEVVIVSKSSGREIAVGTAYLDKSGKIINIRIRNR